MATGQGMLELAREHIGERYRNVLVPKNNANWTGPWDCAEFASWLVFQDAQFLYGCTNNHAQPAVADSYTGAWRDDSASRGIRISIERAMGTVGAFLLRYPPAPGRMGHIAISDGQGGTVEAKGRRYGVVADTAHGRNWNTGVLVPGVHYDGTSTPMAHTPPAKLYAIGQPNMDRKIVRDIQQALLDRDINPGPLDGIYGPLTAMAVAAFQETEGLVVDGQVGPITAEALGINL